MKLAPNFKPQLAASNDDTRYVLQHVCVRHGMAIAINGKMMVAGINEFSDDQAVVDNILLPLPACAAATKKRRKALSVFQNILDVKEDEVEVKVDFDQRCVFKRANITDTNYPNILKVLPDIQKPASITFSAKLLKQLSDALGEESVCLTFDLEDTGKCMIVTPSKIHDRFGLLMPTRFGERGKTNLSENEALERLKKIAGEAETVAKP